MRVDFFHQQDVCSAPEAAGRCVPVNGWSWPVVLLADVVTNQRFSVSERQVSGRLYSFVCSTLADFSRLGNGNSVLKADLYG